MSLVNIRRIQRMLSRQGLVVAFVVLVILFTIKEPGFAEPANVLSILQQSSILIMMSLGVTLVVLGGGIDLSIGESLDFGSLAFINSINAGAGFIGGLGGSILAGSMVGLFNGFLVLAAGVLPFLATLCTTFISKSLQFIYSGGFQSFPVMRFSRAFELVGTGSVIGIPVRVIIILVVVAIFLILIRYTCFGRRVTACGSNLTAAWFVGIPAKLYILMTYVISGVMGSLAGVLLSTRVGMAVPITGGSYLFDVLGAVFMGTSLSPVGRANIVGTVLGALFFGALTNGMTRMAVPPYPQLIVKGAAILLILTVAALGRRIGDYK